MGRYSAGRSLMPERVLYHFNTVVEELRHAVSNPGKQVHIFRGGRELGNGYPLHFPVPTVI